MKTRKQERERKRNRPSRQRKRIAARFEREKKLRKPGAATVFIDGQPHDVSDLTYKQAQLETSQGDAWMRQAGVSKFEVEAHLSITREGFEQLVRSIKAANPAPPDGYYLLRFHPAWERLFRRIVYGGRKGEAARRRIGWTRAVAAAYRREVRMLERDGVKLHLHVDPFVASAERARDTRTEAEHEGLFNGGFATERPIQ